MALRDLAFSENLFFPVVNGDVVGEILMDGLVKGLSIKPRESFANYERMWTTEKGSMGISVEHRDIRFSFSLGGPSVEVTFNEGVIIQLSGDVSYLDNKMLQELKKSFISSLGRSEKHPRRWQINGERNAAILKAIILLQEIAGIHES